MQASALPSGTLSRGRILLVDDDRAVLTAFARMLGAKGFDVTTANNAQDALTLIHTRTMEAVITDIGMSGMDGLQLLRAIREIDLDVQVIIHTAVPSISTAAKAIEYGAFRYLTKPVEWSDFLKTVETAIAVGRVGRDKRVVLEHSDPSRLMADRAGLESSFDRALDQLWIAFQPVVRWSTRDVFAYEALVRTREPSIPNPRILFDAAEQLDRLLDLGRRVRESSAVPFAQHDSGEALLFVNLHAAELADAHLYDAQQPLALIAPRVVLEITERSSLHAIEDARRAVTSLRAMGFRIALDDLGAGYAGLSSFAALDPDMVKVDVSLVRDVHKDAMKRRLIHSVISLATGLNRHVIAEGVETVDERDALVELGCDLFQGYLFAHPGPPFPPIAWDAPANA